MREYVKEEVSLRVQLKVLGFNLNIDNAITVMPGLIRHPVFLLLSGHRVSLV